MARAAADILAVGMVSAVGLSAVTTASSVRAGTSRFRDAPIRDRSGEPMVMALIPSADLPEMAGRRVLAQRHERVSFLAARALAESVRDQGDVAKLPVFLGVPDTHPGLFPPLVPTFLSDLAARADVSFDVRRSRLFPNGRASMFLALQAAMEALESGAVERAVVGGADTWLDALLLLTLEEEGRLLGGGPRDGFIPGEGAAFLLLARSPDRKRAGPEPLARIEAAAHAAEPGHRYSREPYLGAGLDQAFHRVFDAARAAPPIRTVYAGLNGESFSAKEWGVALLRHRERFAEGFAIEHPADCFGDTGAALGAMMVALAAIGMHKGYRQSPCLVWCSSDKAERGAAVVSAARER